MFRMILELGVVHPTLEEGIVELKSDGFISGYREAHQTLDLVLEAMGIEDDTEPEFPGHS